jgi:hypothetical protein
MSYDVNWRNKDSNDIYELYCEQPVPPTAPPVTPKRSAQGLKPGSRIPDRGDPVKPDDVPQDLWDKLPLSDKHAAAEGKLAFTQRLDPDHPASQPLGGAPMPPIGRAISGGLKYAPKALKWAKNLFKKSPKKAPTNPKYPGPHKPGTPKPGAPKSGKGGVGKSIGQGTGVGVGLGAADYLLSPDQDADGDGIPDNLAQQMGQAGQAGGAGGAGIDTDGDGIPDSQDPTDNRSASGGGDGGTGGKSQKIKNATYQLQLPEIYAQQIYDQLGAQLGGGKGIEREVDDEQERQPTDDPGYELPKSAATGKPSNVAPTGLAKYLPSTYGSGKFSSAGSGPHAGAGAVSRQG